MSELRLVDTTTPALLEFRGPDAVRFLNGQLTQDVRKVVGAEQSLPSCVTDAKGKLQFRVTLTERSPDVLWVAAPEGTAEALHARLTRYLIADDVETDDLTGKYDLAHWIGGPPEPPAEIIARSSMRFGVPGVDWWIPTGHPIALPGHTPMSHDERESLRISNGVPAWGRELTEGLLPPEANLEPTDISYVKGCYIGQEVISRIKSAGKVNKRLTRFEWDAAADVACGLLEDGAGEITSISPLVTGDVRHALGYVKRGATDLQYRSTDGTCIAVRSR